MFPWIFLWAPQYNTTWTTRYHQDSSHESLVGTIAAQAAINTLMNTQRHELTEKQLLEIKELQTKFLA